MLSLSNIYLDIASCRIRLSHVHFPPLQDKITLRLFSGMVDAGKLESAFDLVSRLHSEKSYDIAIRIADREYKLADEIENMKKFKFPDDDDEDHTQDDSRSSNTFVDHSECMNSKQISPDSSRAEKPVNEANKRAGIFHKRRRFN